MMKKLIYALLFTVLACSTKPQFDQASNPFLPEKTASIVNQARGSSNVLRIVYASNIQGEIGTCGCAYAPAGGIDRRLNFLNSKKEQDSSTLHIDSGSFLFSSLTLTAGTKSIQISTAHAMAQGYSQLKLDALNVGRFDLVEGHEFLMSLAKRHKLPLVSTNLVDRNSQHLFPKSIKKKLPGGSQVVILGVSSVKREILPGLELQSLDPIASIKEELKNVASQDLLIVLSDLTILENEELAKAISRPMLIVGSKGFDSYALPLHQEKSLVVQTIAQGQEIGDLEIFWPKGGQGYWLNQGGFTNFLKRWDALVAERDFLKKQEDSELLKQEITRNDKAFESLLNYAPQKGKEPIVYQARMTNLDKNWAKKNNLTSLVLKHKKPAPK